MKCLNPLCTCRVEASQPYCSHECEGGAARSVRSAVRVAMKPATGDASESHRSSRIMAKDMPRLMVPVLIYVLRLIRALHDA